MGIRKKVYTKNCPSCSFLSEFDENYNAFCNSGNSKLRKILIEKKGKTLRECKFFVKD